MGELTICRGLLRRSPTMEILFGVLPFPCRASADSWLLLFLLHACLSIANPRARPVAPPHTNHVPQLRVAAPTAVPIPMPMAMPKTVSLPVRKSAIVSVLWRLLEAAANCAGTRSVGSSWAATALNHHRPEAKILVNRERAPTPSVRAVVQPTGLPCLPRNASGLLRS